MRKTKALDKVQWPMPDVITKVIPSPTEGWDAITPLAEMDPKRAPILDNWVPRPGYLELRPGYSPYAAPSSTAVETLMVRRSPTAEQLFAVTNNTIFNVSNPAALVTGPTVTSNRFNYTNFTPSGGIAVIQCCNGADQLLQYDGTTWTNPAITGLPGGGSTATIVNIYSQKKRLWYILKDSTVVAFMPVDAITGAIAGTLTLGNEWVRGGYCVAMSSWTVDGGNGPQDYAVFISSLGEVSIFAGTDPTDASAWSLAGTFTMAPPIGRRCLYRVGSDVAVITQQGVLPLSQVLPFDPSADRSVAITSRIQNAMSQAAYIGSTYYGWQVISYPAQQLAIVNVPISSGATSVQFVMNALTGAWCRFTGWNAACLEIFNGALYFGDFNGFVNLAYSTGTDGGNTINYDMQCAFNWFDDPGRNKRMTMVQPLMVSTGNITPTMGVDVDFATSTTSSTLVNFTGGSLWDLAVWDTGLWGGQLVSLSTWYSVEALGHALAIRMSISNDTQPGTSGVFDVAQFDAGEWDLPLAPPPVLQVNAFNSILELGSFI